MFKNHYSKEKEIAMFLFNKLNSLLALFKDSVISSREYRPLSFYVLVLESCPNYSHVQIMMYLYQYFHTFHQEGDIRNIVKLK